jgi:hypothetical protein
MRLSLKPWLFGLSPGAKRIEYLVARLILLFTFSAAIIALSHSLLGEDTVCDWASFMAGMGLSVVGVHEAGHTAAALALGYPMRTIHYQFSSVEVDGLALGSHDDKVVKMSGFAAQAISTEVILGVKAIPKDSWFVAGILAGNILHPIAYVIRAETGYARDFEGFSIRDKRIAEALVLGHAFFTAYRVYSNKDFPIFITSSGRDISLMFQKTFD